MPSFAVAEIIYISPYNRRTITTHQPQQKALSQKEQQLKAYQDAEDELIEARAPDALSKEDIEAMIDKKMGKKPKPAAAKPIEKPQNSAFGTVGGVGTVGGIGAIGGIGQAGNVNSAGIDAAE